MKTNFLISAKIFTIFLFLLLTTASYAATVTWRGGNGSWDEPSSWDTGSVPTSSDDVFIPSGNVTIRDGSSAVATSLVLSAGSSLTISQNATLTILGARKTPGLHNQGQVDCLGNLNVSNISGPQKSGVLNEGVFTNSGNMTVHHIGYYGIQNAPQSIFVNNGNLDLHNNSTWCVFNEGRFESSDSLIVHNTPGDGVHNTGGFRNSGFLSITPGLNGLLNYADFSNESGGIIRIDGSSTPSFSGVINSRPTQSQTAGVLTNSGYFEVFGARNNINISDGEFNNRGKVACFDAIDNGIRINANGIFRNFRQLENYDHQNNGTTVHGLFVNRRQGNLVSRNNSNDAIRVEAGGEFRNAGYLNIFGSGVKGISNAGTFNNQPRGKLFLADRIYTTVNSSFNNNGHLDCTYTGFHAIVPNTLSNTGAIGDENESFSIPLSPNQGIHVVPLPAQIAVGQPVPNALDLGSLSGMTVGNWTSPTSSQVVGTYNVAANTFTPNPNAAGLDYIKVSITINSTGSQMTYRAPVPGGVQ